VRIERVKVIGGKVGVKEALGKPRHKGITLGGILEREYGVVWAELI
jgi:hypothetical protein